MGGRDKVKASIVVDRRLWEEFRSRVASERGLKALSQAVEEAVEDKMTDWRSPTPLRDSSGAGPRP